MQGILAAGIAPAFVKADSLMKIAAPTYASGGIVTLGEVNPGGWFDERDYNVVIDAQGHTLEEVYNDVKYNLRRSNEEFEALEKKRERYRILYGGRRGGKTYAVNRFIGTGATTKSNT